MSKDSRAWILARLRAAPPSKPVAGSNWQPAAIAAADRVQRFTAMIQAVHGEVHQVDSAVWPQRLLEILGQRGVETVLFSPATLHGRAVATAWGEGAPKLVPYDQNVEVMKDALVHHIDAAITGTVGAIAETGSLVLRPDPQEPRLMSLLPPIHVALLDQAAIHDTLAGMMEQEQWAKSMPTNLLLISGPSKTADIEQTLAYGVHGPKELIVLILK